MKKEKHIEDCYRYTLERLRELSNSYEEQVKNTENFALWNLPNDLANDWENMMYFINILYDNKKIDDNIKNILVQIYENFEKCVDDKVFTHEALKQHSFWTNQRLLAKQALQLMQYGV